MVVDAGCPAVDSDDDDRDEDGDDDQEDEDRSEAGNTRKLKSGKRGGAAPPDDDGRTFGPDDLARAEFHGLTHAFNSQLAVGYPLWPSARAVRPPGQGDVVDGGTLGT